MVHPGITAVMINSGIMLCTIAPVCRCTDPSRSRRHQKRRLRIFEGNEEDELVSTHLSGKGFPSKSSSESSNSWTAGKSVASENPREGRLMKSFTFRGACPLLPTLLIAQEWSFTAARATDKTSDDGQILTGVH